MEITRGFPKGNITRSDYTNLLSSEYEEDARRKLEQMCAIYDLNPVPGWKRAGFASISEALTLSRGAVPTLEISGSPVQLTIPTYEGSGQCVHPSVVYIPAGFAGYTHWMAFTPYPNSSQGYENPSIVASNDGVAWAVPDGITNPLEPAPTPPEHGNDVELIYDGTQLIVFWGTASGVPETHFYRRTISSELVVGDRVECTGILPVSPAIIRESATDWKIWYLDSISLDMCYGSSQNGIDWTRERIIGKFGSYTPWHMQVLKIGENYIFLIAAYFTVGGSSGSTLLYHAFTSDPDIDPCFIPSVLLDVASGWTSRQIYRSCLVEINGNYKIYLSACATDGTWHIGVVDAAIS